MTPTRSQVLEAMARGIEQASWRIGSMAMSGHQFKPGERSEASAQAALQALEGVGMVVVPREPDSDMRWAAATVAAKNDPVKGWQAEGKAAAVFARIILAGYRAMIAASQDQGSARDHAPSTEKATPKSAAPTPVHADDCQSHIVDVRGRPDDCTCGATPNPQSSGAEG